jgi:acyl carrier protein
MMEWENMRAGMAEILSMPLNELHGDTILTTSENWDSLAIVGTVALLFEMTGASVSHEEISGAVTLQGIFDLAARKIKERA